MPGRAADFTVMGIVNVTPDSFSDGGLYIDAGAAVAHGLELEAEGAGILDVGGESTRPGAEPVPPREELERVIPGDRGAGGGRHRRPDLDRHLQGPGGRGGARRRERRWSTTSPPCVATLTWPT